MLSGPGRPGKLLASGLESQSENPEAVHCWTSSSATPPRRSSSRGEVRSGLRWRRGRKPRSFNGLERDAQGEQERPSGLRSCGPGPCTSFANVEGAGERGVEDGPWKADAKGMVTFRWIANLGWQTQPAGGKFTFASGHEELLTSTSRSIGPPGGAGTARWFCVTRSRASTETRTARGSWS